MEPLRRGIMRDTPPLLDCRGRRRIRGIQFQRKRDAMFTNTRAQKNIDRRCHIEPELRKNFFRLLFYIFVHTDIQVCRHRCHIAHLTISILHDFVQCQYIVIHSHITAIATSQRPSRAHRARAAPCRSKTPTMVRDDSRRDSTRARRPSQRQSRVRTIAPLPLLQVLRARRRPRPSLLAPPMPRSAKVPSSAHDVAERQGKKR